MFPGVAFGVLLGNLKFGSVCRGMGTTWANRREINYRAHIPFLVVGSLFAFAGAKFIGYLSAQWIIYAIALAILISELAPFLKERIETLSVFWKGIIAIPVGFYSGIFGAGIGVILTAVLRIEDSDDTQIGDVKIQSRYVEWILGIAALLAHITSSNVIWEIARVWGPANLLGGVIGGYLLVELGKLSGNTQKLFLRITYVIALAVAFYKIFIIP